jgi:hypothetical protein
MYSLRALEGSVVQEYCDGRHCTRFYSTLRLYLAIYLMRQCEVLNTESDWQLFLRHPTPTVLKIKHSPHLISEEGWTTGSDRLRQLQRNEFSNNSSSELIRGTKAE